MVRHRQINRRRFLQMLGVAPAALIATKYLPKLQKTQKVYYHDIIVKWQPTTVFCVGDKIKISGFTGYDGVYQVIQAGTSGITPDNPGILQMRRV